MTIAETLSAMIFCLFLSTAWSADGYILRAGDGEALLNGAAGWQKGKPVVRAARDGISPPAPTPQRRADDLRLAVW